MKTVCFSVVLFFITFFASFSILNAQALSSYNGEWKNTNTGTRGLVSIKIGVSGSAVTVQPFGACSPTPCDWGVANALAYSTSVSTNTTTTTRALTAQFKTGFSETILVAELNGSTLEVRTYTRFTDGSGRFNYTSKEKFQKATVTNLNAPTLTSPTCGSTFSNFPRTTTLKWNAVSGAASYIVEVDCYHCCESGKWCTEVGKTHIRKTGITATEFTFDFVGAQPGRWRVSAVDSKGKEGAKSAWCNFTYTK